MSKVNLRNQTDNGLSNLLFMYQRKAVEGISADERREARVQMIEIQAEQRRRREWKYGRG